MQRLLNISGWLSFIASDAHDGDMRCSVSEEQAARCRAILRRADFSHERLVLANQVHGRNLEVADHGSPALLPTADALMTNAPGMALGVTAADCCPVLVWSETARCVALVHAGRQGVLCDIVLHVISSMVAYYRVPVASLRAVIGPCICRDHYEVEDEVAAPFKERYSEHVIPSRNGGHSLLDLPGIITDQAWLLGVPKGEVRQVGGCTYEREHLWFSYRRDAHHARLIGEPAPTPRVQVFLAVTGD